MKKEPSRSKALAARTLYAAMQALKERGGSMPVREVIEQVERRVPLDDWSKERYDSTGYVRWQSNLHFFSIDFVKAGYLVKKKGVWYLTPEGEEALSLGDAGMLNAAQEAYRAWRARRPGPDDDGPDDKEPEKKKSALTLEQIESLAIEGLKEHIAEKNAYEFQDLAAALLRGMGYFTPFVAPRGKDGGVDILAYRDPLGTSTPRMKVQVKHRVGPATVQEVRQLIGLLIKDGDVGIFFSTGGFTTDALGAARSAHIHMELIDLDRFITLWQDFYPKLSDEDKAHLPLMPVYFLEPIE